MEVALGAIALATAVKDLVELGQKIHESFAKVSSNLRKAQRVAKDIKEKAEKINIFYENHKDALDNMENFRVALLGLLDKFRSFETSVLPLLPKTGGRRLRRFIRGWWNNNKIEGRISDLQNNVVQVMLEYMMESAMRAEVKLETIQQETSRGLTGITQGLEVLEVVRRDISAIRITAVPTTTYYPYDPSGTTSDELERNITQFAQTTRSTSAPMLLTPSVITEEIMTTAYIKLQINKIAMAVETMSTLPTSATISIVFPLSKIFEQSSMGIMHLRHDVVRQVTIIRDLLDTERIQTVSIYDGARALNELAVGLKQLHMFDELRLVGNWAISLARLLVNVFGNSQPNAAAFLALYLANQCHSSSGRIRRLQLIKEAYAITQNLRGQHAGEVTFQILHSYVLLQYADLVDARVSIEMSIEAVLVLEDIFNVHAFNQSNSHNISNIVQPSSSFLNRLFSSAPTVFSILTYASALCKVAVHISDCGRHYSARDLMLLAIAVLRELVSIYGHEHRVHRVQLAQALFSLTVFDWRISSCIPTEERISMFDECIQLFRVLAEQNPLSYGRKLVLALDRKAEALASLNRDAEAIAAWQDAASVAEQIVQDARLCALALSDLSRYFRRLKRHDDAARTAALAIATRPQDDDDPWGYSDLSGDLQQLRRYKEAAEAAQTSVTLHRRDATRWPELVKRYLVEGLSKLSHCLAASGEYSEALMAWKESLNIIDNFLNHKPDAKLLGTQPSKDYLAALRIHLSISYVLEDEEECLKVCSTAVQYLRQLSEIDLQRGEKEEKILSLLSAEFCYASAMIRFGNLQVAKQYIDHWIDVWRSSLWEIPEPKTAEWGAAMIILKANILDAQGYTERALLVIQEAHDIVRPFIKTHQPLFDKMINSMVKEAQLQVHLGNQEEALRVAEGALHLCRDSTLDAVIDTIILSLHEVASAALSCGDYKRAHEAAHEGRNILIQPEGLNVWETSDENISKRASLYSIMSYTEANLGRRGNAVEYAHRSVEASQEIGEIKAYISATTAKHAYMESRGNLADVLLATGDIAQVLEICEERKIYFSRRVEKRMGEYRELAPILRMLGILCCSEGRHEEGEAVAQELSRIMTTLQTIFTSLHEQVKIRLRHQAEVPSLKVLEEMSQKLECNHQRDIISLFAI